MKQLKNKAMNISFALLGVVVVVLCGGPFGSFV
jgi:hypothetical protein